MTEIKEVDDKFTEEQIKDTRQLIDVLMGLKEEKRPLFIALTIAYIDGVETGTKLKTII